MEWLEKPCLNPLLERLFFQAFFTQQQFYWITRRMSLKSTTANIKRAKIKTSISENFFCHEMQAANNVINFFLIKSVPVQFDQAEKR